MTGETRITIIGNLTADPEIRTTQSGRELASFTIASTPRQFDRQTNEWKDGETTFLDCVAWRNVLAIRSATWKGLRVIAHGVISQRNFETRNGEKRSKLELEVEAMGVVLADAAYAQPQAGADAWSAPPAAAPAASAPPAAAPPAEGSWSGYGDQTPF